MEYLSIIASILSLTIAIAAITLNNRYASQREYRKEFRNRLEGILDRIDEVEFLAVKFHTSLDYSADSADGIRWRIERLSRHIQTIPIFKSDKEISKHFNEFKRSMTSVNFGKSHELQCVYIDKKHV